MQWFNATRNYREATIRALDKQVEVFKTLVDGEEDFCGQVLHGAVIWLLLLHIADVTLLIPVCR